MTSTCLSTTWPDNSFPLGQTDSENARGASAKGAWQEETKVRRQVQRTFVSHTYKLRARLCRVRLGLSTKELRDRTQDEAEGSFTVGGSGTYGKSTESNVSPAMAA